MPKNKLKSALLLGFFAACFSAALLYAQSKDHSAIIKQIGCLACHYSVSENDANKYVLKRSSSDNCTRCHALSTQKRHPLNVEAPKGCSLPLEDNKYIGCLTCHSPHTASMSVSLYAPPQVSPAYNDLYNTYLLNTPNNEGQLCAKCHADSKTRFKISLHNPRASDNLNYAGSESCRKCHLDIYDEWKLTVHARMTRKFRQFEPRDGLALSEEDIIKNRVVWVLGSHYVNRFVAESSGTLIVLPQIYSINEKKYLPDTDYQLRSRLWLKNCAGCHTTGFSAQNNSFAEAGIGCEACHGPGQDHINTKDKAKIVSLSSMTKEQQEMVCMACHTSGVDKTGQYSFPVGYRPGGDLTNYYSGLTPKPGQSFENFYGDETYEDRLRQWVFLKERLFLASGLTCDYCKNFRDIKTADNSKFLTHNAFCLTCHAGPCIRRFALR